MTAATRGGDDLASVNKSTGGSFLAAHSLVSLGNEIWEQNALRAGADKELLEI